MTNELEFVVYIPPLDISPDEVSDTLKHFRLIQHIRPGLYRFTRIGDNALTIPDAAPVPPPTVPPPATDTWYTPLLAQHAKEHVLGARMGGVFIKDDLAFEIFAGGAGTESEGKCVVVAARGAGRAVLVKNSFGAKYLEPGVMDRMGAPLGPEFGARDGARQTFKNGYFTWTRSAGVKMYNSGGNEM